MRRQGCTLKGVSFDLHAVQTTGASNNILQKELRLSCCIFGLFRLATMPTKGTACLRYCFICMSVFF